ncbi:MAG: Bifunctional protein FolD protein [Candidatus Anoxychlamydiales bacterium]|nr:Bifunctional protein FolD protein [Candidatus Anoxychlamydiales bacterium]
MKIINGKEIADKIILDIKNEIISKNLNVGLAVILIGDDFASKTYVRMKRKKCLDANINSYLFEYSNSIDEKTIIDKIHALNNDDKIDGILVQLPLPKHISIKTVIEAIDPNKDIDGFHPINVGKVLLGYDDTIFPCTPLGIKILLEKTKIDLTGKHVVIIGRSNLVGKPLFAMLVQNKKKLNATVTICHSYTKDLKQIALSADIIIAAIGKANFITKDFIKKGSIVIDVGINYENQSDGTKKIVGDVDYENVKELCSYITPVPKGVGPMTIAMLLKNSLICHKKNKKYE